MAGRPDQELSAVLYRRVLALLGRPDPDAIPRSKTHSNKPANASPRSACNTNKPNEHSND
jgi:hypothetical protein